jgi:uncharacterized membrane protein
LAVESNRLLGGIAACLTAVGVVAQITAVVSYSFPLSAVDLVLLGVGSFVGFLSFVGFILYLVAMHGFSRDYDEHRIFDYVLYGFIIAIVVGVIFAVVFGAFVLSSVLSSSQAINPLDPSQITSLITQSFMTFLPVFGILGVIYIAFNLRAFNLLADKSGVSLFRTGAKVLFAGAVLGFILELSSVALASFEPISYSNILAISFPSVLIQDGAWALLAIAFLRIRTDGTVQRALC